MAQRGFKMVRYADDFVILCRDRTTAERALKMVEDWTSNAGLTLHPEKTRIIDAEEETSISWAITSTPSIAGHGRRALRNFEPRFT